MKNILKSLALMLCIITISCKNNAQELLTELPKELAHKTWIYIAKNETDSYKNILKSLSDSPESSSIKTGKNEVSLKVNEYGEYATLDIDSIIVIDNGFKLELDGFVDFINFIWLDKTKGIASWEIKYDRYNREGERIANVLLINKDFVTPENFPEPKKPEITIENEISEDTSKYLRIEELPIKGKFICNTGNPGLLSLISKEVNLYDSEGGITEVQPYEAQIVFDQYNGLDCSLRKIKGTSNKYALFFERITDATNNYAKDILHYSKKRPVAEIEIIDNNTIKKKWIGLYNRRTEKVENYSNAEYLDWRDDCNGIVKRVE